MEKIALFDVNNDNLYVDLFKNSEEEMKKLKAATNDAKEKETDTKRKSGRVVFPITKSKSEGLFDQFDEKDKERTLQLVDQSSTDFALFRSLQHNCHNLLYKAQQVGWT